MGFREDEFIDFDYWVYAGECRLTTKIVKTLFDFHRGWEGVDRRTNSSGTNVSIVFSPRNPHCLNLGASLLLRVNIYLVFDGSLSALLEKSNSGRLVLVNNKKSLHLFSSPHQLAWELCNILYLNYTECAWHATYTWLSRWQTPVFPIQSRQSGSYLLRNNRENLYQQRFLDWYANC